MLVANHLAGLLRAGLDNLADTHTGPYADQITPATQAPGAGRPTTTNKTPTPSRLRPIQGLLWLAGHSVALQMPVHRRARHPEQVRDLLDGLVSRVVQLLGEGSLVGV